MSLKIDFFDGEKRIIAVVRDIDRRKRAEEISQENEKRYRRLVENSPDIIYRISIPNGKLEYVSPAVKNITGYLPDEWLNHHNIFQEIIPQEQWTTLFWSLVRLSKVELPPSTNTELFIKMAVSYGLTSERRLFEIMPERLWPSRGLLRISPIVGKLKKR